MSESLGAARSGMTFEAALAERAGLSEKAIGTLERGDRTTPRPATVVLLAQAVGASPAERDRLLATAHAEQHPPTETRQPT
ncbi:MAG: helix-turn-helix domain-containing protein [Chloroflexi bacterium]|nr:helix-turn-helix domain-containing protein [Chloroflexota bacterium]